VVTVVATRPLTRDEAWTVMEPGNTSSSARRAVDAPAGIGPGAGAGGMSETVGGAMAGLRVVVPETRELEVLARMLERQGAEAIRCPLVAIIDAPDPAPWRPGCGASSPRRRMT
jgi:hypothetical protein